MYVFNNEDPKDAAALSNVSHGSLIGTGLFLVIKNGLPIGLQLIFWLITDDTAIGGKTMDVGMHQKGVT